MQSEEIIVSPLVRLELNIDIHVASVGGLAAGAGSKNTNTTNSEFADIVASALQRIQRIDHVTSLAQLLGPSSC